MPGQLSQVKLMLAIRSNKTLWPVILNVHVSCSYYVWCVYVPRYWVFVYIIIMYIYIYPVAADIYVPRYWVYLYIITYTNLTSRAPQSPTVRAPPGLTIRTSPRLTIRVPLSLTVRIPLSLTIRAPPSLTIRTPQSLAVSQSNTVLNRVISKRTLLVK